ncbi:C-type lectin domain family 9 member A-like [Equus caballus]|uniref:C-type lectin domain-containing protein n=1 Tax=Equus caballus TaxID=9796 RepID=A0A3Q2H922_HORSE|nr:C-type lectin domain family 9 member A-like [Equus caballus]
MNAKHITYAEVKHHPSKKQMQKEKIKEQLIYSEVKTCTLNSNPTKITRTEPSKAKGSSVPLAWCLTVVILGIFCVCLLLTTGVLGYRVFQGRQTDLPKNTPWDNVTQEDNSTFKNTAVKEEPLNRGSESSTCETKWSCCGKKCYHFSHDLKNFEESKKVCKKMDSTLLKIEDEKELHFIQSQLSYFSWIGLSRKGTRSSWTWEDNSPPLLNVDWNESKNGNCGSLTATRMAASDCSRFMYYICEKKMAHLATYREQQNKRQI